MYEQKGWRGKAIEHNEKFFDLWKDADTGIAEAEVAKKRMEGGKNNSLRNISVLANDYYANWLNF